MVDIRFPIGFMFTLLGLIITVYGFLTLSDKEIYRISLGININIVMGIVMLVFGLVMLFFAYRTKRK